MSYYICTYLDSKKKVIKTRRINTFSHDEACRLFRRDHIKYPFYENTIQVKLGKKTLTYKHPFIVDEDYFDEDEEDEDEDDYDDEYDDYEDEDYYDDEEEDDDDDYNYPYGR